MLFIVCICVAIAQVLSLLLRQRGAAVRWGIILALSAGAIAEFHFPMGFVPVVPIQEAAPVYRWLEKTPTDSPVIFMPIYNWNMAGAGEEIQREYYSTIAFRRMVNGYSGFSSIPWQDFVYFETKNFPSNESVDKIRGIGVQYIIVDRHRYDSDFKSMTEPVDGSKVLGTLWKNRSLKEVAEMDGFYIFRFIDAPGGSESTQRKQ
jgi:hypothetical protein